MRVPPRMMQGWLITGALLLIIALTPAVGWAGEFLLVPMDLGQPNHLRAYGHAYHSLQAGEKVITSSYDNYGDNIDKLILK